MFRNTPVTHKVAGVFYIMAMNTTYRTTYRVSFGVTDNA